MNNFADDTFYHQEDAPEIREDAPQAEKTIQNDDFVNEDSFFRRKAIRIPVRVCLGLFIIGTAISLYWARIPQTFDVTEMARTKAVEYGHRELNEPLPNGYRTVATIMYMAEQLLEKPGGYQSNGISPMTRMPDNMRNWEYGSVVQLRVMVQGLRFELSRSGQQSAEHVELREAETRFNFNHDKIILPSTEKQYKEGIKFLKQYLDGMDAATTEGKYFSSRQDQVIRWLDRQKIMLGDYASRLQNNVGAVSFDTGVLTSELPPDILDAQVESQKKVASNEVTSFFERDDVFYQVRGGVYVMYHTMLAMRKDCEKVLNDSQSMGIMNRIINELEAASKPMGSPMVLNGSEYGVIQNHSLVLGAHVAKAHLAVQELQRQIAGGGGGN